MSGYISTNSGILITRKWAYKMQGRYAQPDVKPVTVPKTFIEQTTIELQGVYIPSIHHLNGSLSALFK